MLWRALTLPNLSGARLHGFLDGSTPAPPKTVTQGTGDAARPVSNPDFEHWWTLDQKVLGLLLGSMNEDIAAQLIGCTTAAAAWAAVHSLFGAQNSAGVRHLRRQIHALRKEEKPAAEYMQKVKGMADAMAATGTPLRNDEIIDYMLTGLGKAFNPIAASMNFSTVPVTLAVFYNNVLNFEALQKQQEEDGDWATTTIPAVVAVLQVVTPGREAPAMAVRVAKAMAITARTATAMAVAMAVETVAATVAAMEEAAMAATGAGALGVRFVNNGGMRRRTAASATTPTTAPGTLLRPLPVIRLTGLWTRGLLIT
jgi:hypothetical protein